MDSRLMCPADISLLSEQCPAGEDLTGQAQMVVMGAALLQTLNRTEIFPIGIVVKETFGFLAYYIQDLGEAGKSLVTDIKDFFADIVAESEVDCRERLEQEIPKKMNTSEIQSLLFERAKKAADKELQLDACRSSITLTAERSEAYLESGKLFNPYEGELVHDEKGNIVKDSQENLEVFIPSHPSIRPPFWDDEIDYFSREQAPARIDERPGFLARYAASRCIGAKQYSRDDICLNYIGKNNVRRFFNPPCNGNQAAIAFDICHTDRMKSRDFVAAAKETATKMKEAPFQIIPQIIISNPRITLENGRSLFAQDHAKTFPCGEQQVARELEFHDLEQAVQSAIHAIESGQSAHDEARRRQIDDECSLSERRKRAFTF